jgi:nickel-dependent lactate racemase
LTIKKISIPYGNDSLTAQIPEELILFSGEMASLPALPNFEDYLLQKLDRPIGCGPLKSLIASSDRVLILVEDNTRNTPVKRILPALLAYLEKGGVALARVEILTAPGTHRVMTEKELAEKIGEGIARKAKVSQHDFRNAREIADLGAVQVGQSRIPVQVNRKILEADFLIGIGDIVPHADAGFSGGAKIVQPGVCGFATTAATHIAGALLDEIPLGEVANPCRLGMEEVARRVKLRFIINVIKNYQNEVVEVVAGDFVQAHRQGVVAARKSFGVSIPALADVVIVSSYPCDIDYWQAEKGLISAYFAIKKGGIIIFVAPCPEGMEHNHPRLRDWIKMTYAEACAAARRISPEDTQADLIAADLAICNSRIREKADVYLISDGLSQEESTILGYRKFGALQQAVNCARERFPTGRFGLLPRGGDCLPLLSSPETSR